MQHEHAHADGRGRLVALTPAGRRLIDEAFTAHMANEARLLEPFDAAERAQLAGLLERWATHLGLSAPRLICSDPN